MTKRFLNTLVAVASFLALHGQTAPNLVLVTLDGLRWEELFSGADSMLISQPEIVKDTASLKLQFWREDHRQRRVTLMPFIWGQMARNGQLYGNRLLDNKMNCSNIFWFSYPGYAEILCGKTNATAIHSNEKLNNPDTTFLEHLNQLNDYHGKVAAFSSWDVFPYIINQDRSQIPVNAGFDKAVDSDLTDKERFLNTLQDQIPSPWSSVRLDAFTHHFAMEYMARRHPKIIYIAYGETDDFAHDGRYDHYLHAANRADRFIQNLWQFLQEDPFYRGKTNLVITTDHGRGTWQDGAWKSHGKTYHGSNAIWLAAMGPNITKGGEMGSPMQLWQNQVAASCLRLLSKEALIDPEMGAPISSLWAGK